MNKLVVGSILLILSAPLAAEQLLKTVSFAELSGAGVLLGGELRDGDTLTVEAIPGNEFQPLLALEQPGIHSPVYALKGRVRYADVEGEGFLELDSHFAGKGTFFTKSLATAGPLGKLSGSSDWRPFVLPFYANSGDQADAAAPLPDRLTLSLFLPGSGTVSISGVALYEYAAGEDPLGSNAAWREGQWLDGRTATLLGAIGGSLLGLWGALIGVISARGKARGFVLGSTTLLLLLGIVSVGVGLAALASAQSHAVYYPFLSLGILLIVLMAVLRRTFSARYEHLELKRMQSMDA
jgi:hypothetical protein